MHVPLSMMMLSARKHVLCEKPMSLTTAGARKVLQFAQQQQLLYVEVTSDCGNKQQNVILWSENVGVVNW